MSVMGIFRQTDRQKSFREKGYIVIDAFDEAVIEALRQLKHKMPPKVKEAPLYASNYETDYANNQRIETGIQDILNDPLNDVFNNYHFLTGHFMIKSPGPDSEFQLHQDWSITDEQVYEVVHLWIPLQDTSPDNGGMFVVDGSHLFFNNLRSGSLDIPRLERDPYVRQIITPLSVKRGEMLVYHPALFHGSFPNTSHADRDVVLVNLIQKGAPLLYYHLASKNEVEVFALSKMALMSDLPFMAKGGRPSGLELLSKQPLQQPDNAAITGRELSQRYNARYRSARQSFFQQILRRILGSR